MEAEEDTSADIGLRAEEVAEWYFRLNGFFLIPGFIVHPDEMRNTPRTEADLLGIRLKHSKESLWRPNKHVHFRTGTNRADMNDDRVFTQASQVGSKRKHLVAMVEVKASKCSINGPWSHEGKELQGPGKNNMERALSRVGFGNDDEISNASISMYQELRYEGSEFIVQYFAIGQYRSDELKLKYPKLIQITFDDIGKFLRWRFNGFPEKIPEKASITLWPGFGSKFTNWFQRNGYTVSPSDEKCQRAIKNYIKFGEC